MMANQMTIHDLGKPLASGRTAEVYDWKPGWVLKLFFCLERTRDCRLRAPHHCCNLCDWLAVSHGRRHHLH